jgi:NADPH-dependent 2,4-dienoyl-CoA reductase/sulfur reductase-like enzyme
MSGADPGYGLECVVQLPTPARESGGVRHMSSSAIGPRRHRVVIIGSGFGGLFAAKKLKRADVDVTVIAKTTHHLFQPLLYQVATGILSSGEIAPATRIILRKQKNALVVLGDVVKIDLKNKTVTSQLLDFERVTPLDSLVVAAGAQQSYFGNDHFAEFAPGMKTIDDALELRGRILGAFELAETATTQAERERRLTFVVVGAGPTGVEVAGQISELAHRTLAGAFRTFNSSDARVILLDAAPAVLAPMGEKLGLKAQRRLEKMGVEARLNAMVTDVDYTGLTLKDKDGTEHRIRVRMQGLGGWGSGEPAWAADRRTIGRDGMRPGRPRHRRAGSHGQGASQCVRRGRHDVGARRARPGSRCDPGQRLRRQANQARTQGREKWGPRDSRAVQVLRQGQHGNDFPP